jgi:hypothetical protein
VVGGDEHHLVRHEFRRDRVYKLTHSGLFGCYSYFSPLDPELTGKHFMARVMRIPFSICAGGCCSTR